MLRGVVKYGIIGILCFVAGLAIAQPKIFTDEDDGIPYYKVPVEVMQQIIVSYRVMEQTAISLQEENKELKKKKSCKDT